MTGVQSFRLGKVVIVLPHHLVLATVVYLILSTHPVCEGDQGGRKKKKLERSHGNSAHWTKAISSSWALSPPSPRPPLRPPRPPSPNLAAANWKKSFQNHWFPRADAEGTKKVFSFTKTTLTPKIPTSNLQAGAPNLERKRVR